MGTNIKMSLMPKGINEIIYNPGVFKADIFGLTVLCRLAVLCVNFFKKIIREFSRKN
jgi:hypothetical protein